MSGWWRGAAAMRAASPGAKPGRELYGIQLLRACAAVAVVAHHSLEESNGAAGKFSPDWLTTVGAAGVDLFFVISGFIMLYVSFPPNRAPARPVGFLLRRATRIYPLYWLCCLGVLAVTSAGFMQHHAWSVGDVAASIVLWPVGNALIGVSWTLVYEVFFYLIFAMFLRIGTRRAAVVGPTLVIANLAWLAVPLPHGALHAFLTDPIPLEFCMGLWLAWGFGAGAGRPERWPAGWIPAALGVVLLSVAAAIVPHADTAGLQGLPRVLTWGLPAVLIVGAVLQIGPPRGRLARFLQLLGDASYALYLTHVFVMWVYARLIKTSVVGALDQRFLVPVVVVVAVVVALFVHLAIEKPMLRLVRSMTRRATGGKEARQAVLF